MNLHINKNEFEDLAILTSEYIKIPPTAIRRDYFIVKLLDNLQNSEFNEFTVFKGGTSLSKCYPGSINRFSEDIDLTFIAKQELSDNQYDRELKKLERIIIGDAFFEKINEERNNRNKSCYVWFDEKDKEKERIKLEIGSKIRPEPFGKRTLRSYIHEYLENRGEIEAIEEYSLSPVTLNVLNIERTFIDKLFSVRRHTLCNTMDKKVRHLYDIAQLYPMPEIQELIKDKESLRKIVAMTKETDEFYLQKRELPEEFNPREPYSFRDWKSKLIPIKEKYESLHKSLLYTDEKQVFSKALEIMDEIGEIFEKIAE